ncbi:YgaP family membrane protein [Halorubrum alkaliphilum]|uniref:YgaP family membrane protein n=1 Tax=Halorubrum alkaliphilum TaxID=261290 RepID=UPI002AA2A0BA|nr:DUF2892 domain-containing protein [Halorubrum alkaliphilum]
MWICDFCLASITQHYIYESSILVYDVNKNVGPTDQRVRTAIGAVSGVTAIATLLGAVPLPPAVSPVLGVVALLLLGTASVRNCPAYSLLGVDSCSRASNVSE